jgi:hypothetical protein
MQCGVGEGICFFCAFLYFLFLGFLLFAKLFSIGASIEMRAVYAWHIHIVVYGYRFGIYGHHLAVFSG